MGRNLHGTTAGGVAPDSAVRSVVSEGEKGPNSVATVLSKQTLPQQALAKTLGLDHLHAPSRKWPTWRFVQTSNLPPWPLIWDHRFHLRLPSLRFSQDLSGTCEQITYTIHFRPGSTGLIRHYASLRNHQVAAMGYNFLLHVPSRRRFRCV